MWLIQDCAQTRFRRVDRRVLVWGARKRAVNFLWSFSCSIFLSWVVLCDQVKSVETIGFCFILQKLWAGSDHFQLKLPFKF
jgi:hypothetical protein